MPRSIKATLEEARRHDDYFEEWIVSEFTEELSRRMEVLGLNRTAFATKIDSSPAYVTKVLRGEENLTAKTMAKLARAVGTVVRVHLAPPGSYTVWIDWGNAEFATPVSAANMSAVAFGETSVSSFGTQVTTMTTSAGVIS